MPKPTTAAQISSALRKDDPQLVELSKDPRGVLLKKAKIEVTPKQSAAIKKYIADTNELASHFAQDGKVVGVNWKKAAKALCDLISALLE